MKKTFIISALALCFSIVTVNAKTFDTAVTNYETTAYFKVSPFCVSIAKGDIDTVKKLINLGADINERSNGMTPVMYAAKFNRADILELLISKGAKLKAKSDFKKCGLFEITRFPSTIAWLLILKQITF